jgi:predicted nucleic acid-binding protein
VRSDSGGTIAGLTMRNADAIYAISRGLACLPLPSVDSFIHAGELKARARQMGRPVRGIADCLIAVIAAAHVGEVLIHRYQGFTTLASLMNLDADLWCW